MDKEGRPPLTARDYLKPEILLKIDKLDLRARVVVEGFLAGLHTSPFHGQSVEFSEHMPYNPGDPVELIDWKVYARTERYFLKRFHEETNMKVYILLDISNSMNYGKPLTKLEYAKILTASLSYLLLKQNDAVGILTFNTKMLDFLPPIGSMGYIQRILSILEKSSPGGKTNIRSVLEKFSDFLKRRSLLILVSDLLEEPESIFSPLRGYIKRKNEVIVLHILHKNEIEFNLRHSTFLRDLETGKRIPVSPYALKLHYRKAFSRYLEEIRIKAGNSRADYHLITTDIPLDIALTSVLLRRITH